MPRLPEHVAEEYAREWIEIEIQRALGTGVLEETLTKAFRAATRRVLNYIGSEGLTIDDAVAIKDVLYDYLIECDLVINGPYCPACSNAKIDVDSIFCPLHLEYGTNPQPWECEDYNEVKVVLVELEKRDAMQRQRIVESLITQLDD